jgi:hypothetical protein
MSLDRFNKFIGKVPEELSSAEKWRRAVVRNGNLDWQGLPIDRNAGHPQASRPEQRAFRERVEDFLDRRGLRIERRNEHIPELIPDQLFDQQAERTERARERRFDEPLGKFRDRSMYDYLRDGALVRVANLFGTAADCER